MGPDDFLGARLLNVSDGTSILADGTLYLSGPFQHFNGMAAPNLVRLYLGELIPRLQGEQALESEFRVIVHGLPGGVYPMEASGDWEHWQSAGEVRLTEYEREARFTLPASAEGIRFLRLKSPEP